MASFFDNPFYSLGQAFDKYSELRGKYRKLKAENVELKQTLDRYKKVSKEFIKQWDALEYMDEHCRGCAESILVIDEFIEILEELEECTKS
jgi:hypothetical protein